MYEVSVRSHFDAAHYLRGYEGKCENLHGHRFEVVVNLRAGKVDEVGMAYDFSKLKKQLAQVVDTLDHQCLNELPAFSSVNPSSENLAVFIYNGLGPLLVGQDDVRIWSVQVWESPESAVTYFPHE